jgi:diaminopimelate decarboxylase
MTHFVPQPPQTSSLMIGNWSARDLVNRFGSPLYVMDEALIRARMRLYKTEFKHPDFNTLITYAGKAFLTKAMVQIADQEGLNLDVVSLGELMTALSVNFPPHRLILHGNNKSMEELQAAIEAGVGVIVLDNPDEVQRIKSLHPTQPLRVLLRINPGIEAHTHDYIKTAKQDSKFGMSLADPKTFTLIRDLHRDPQFTLLGLHCHIGSQIQAIDAYLETVDVVLSTLQRLKAEGIDLRVLNLGGGLGARYLDSDPILDYAKVLNTLAHALADGLKSKNLLLDHVILEPGRSIVAEAGTTLYTVGSIKTTVTGKTYVMVDGSMADHLRTALYQAQYTALAAEKLNQPHDQVITLAGKACESGDILIHEAHLPIMVEGDLIAVKSTGAYHYSMASNYNRLLKPAVVLVNGDQARIIVKRETIEDLLRNDEVIA